MTSIEADESRACFLSLLQFELNLFHSKLPGLYWILCYRSYSLVLANNRFYFTVSTTSIFILFYCYCRGTAFSTSLQNSTPMQPSLAL